MYHHSRPLLTQCALTRWMTRPGAKKFAKPRFYRLVPSPAELWFYTSKVTARPRGKVPLRDEKGNPATVLSEVNRVMVVLPSKKSFAMLCKGEEEALRWAEAIETLVKEEHECKKQAAASARRRAIETLAKTASRLMLLKRRKGGTGSSLAPDPVRLDVKGTAASVSTQNLNTGDGAVSGSSVSRPDLTIDPKIRNSPLAKAHGARRLTPKDRPGAPSSSDEEGLPTVKLEKAASTMTIDSGIYPGRLDVSFYQK